MILDQLEKKGFKELLKFPCRFSFSVIGADDGSLEKNIRKIIEENHKLTIYNPITCKKSAKNNYVSLKVATKVHSEEELTEIYAELGKIEGVRYVL